jgi:TolA-binding protein
MTMTDVKTLDARITKLQGQLARMQSRRQRLAMREQRAAEKVHREQELRRRALAGELLLGAVERGELSASTVAEWCEALQVDGFERALLGV